MLYSTIAADGSNRERIQGLHGREQSVDASAIDTDNVICNLSALVNAVLILARLAWMVPRDIYIVPTLSSSSKAEIWQVKRTMSDTSVAASRMTSNNP